MTHDVTAVTGTLATWLLEQIEEDERVARDAAESADSVDWERVEHIDVPGRAVVSGCGGSLWDGEYPSELASVPTADHIAQWDPARVLAECEAKRRIIEENHSILRLLALALPYSDRPGYRQEWAP